MSRHTRSNHPLLSPADESGDGASGVEDSPRGTAPFERHGAVATDLFGGPTASNAHAFASTPDAMPTSMLSPQYAAWQSPGGPHRARTAASSIDETPETGPSNHLNLAPPRIERQAPTVRVQPHGRAPPHPVFASPTSNAGVNGGGHTLLTRLPTAPTGVTAFGSPTEMSLSTSFSFAPRAAPANAILTLPAARAPLPHLAAPHAPVRSARPTTATSNVTTTAATTTTGSTNLDAAARAAERRIREARAASRAGEEAQVARSVSFSPVVSTPQNPAAGGVMIHGFRGAAPPALNRAGAAPGAVRTRADAGLDSISHLNWAASHPHQRLSGGTESNLSVSVDSSLARPTATRLFPSSSSAVEAPTSSLFGTSSTTCPHAASEASASQSWTAENTSTCTSAATAVVEPPTVRLRKWDGSQTVVPAYLVSDAAEQVLEEQWFEYDTVHRFDPASIVERQSRGIAGTAGETSQEEQADSVKSILEIQLGLRGLHGWYGHTFTNRSTADAVSKKRRRTSSPESSSSSPSTTAEPIIVYDPFGRIRGHVFVPNYAVRGGPNFPLPSPRETFALRHHATATHTLATTEKLIAKEDALYLAANPQSKPNPAQISKALSTFHAQHRTQMLKGLQNALLSPHAHHRR